MNKVDKQIGRGYKHEALKQEVNDDGEVSTYIGDPHELSYAFVKWLKKKAKKRKARIDIYDDAVFVVFKEKDIA